MKKLLFVLLLTSWVVSAEAAQTLGDIAQLVRTGALPPLRALGMGIFFVSGVFMFGAGLLSLKKSAQSQGQQPYMVPITKIVAGVFLIFLASLAANVGGTVGLEPTGGGSYSK